MDIANEALMGLLVFMPLRGSVTSTNPSWEIRDSWEIAGVIGRSGGGSWDTVARVGHEDGSLPRDYREIGAGEAGNEAGAEDRAGGEAGGETP